MQLKPTGKRLLVEKIKKESQSLIIVERHDEPSPAKVLYVGDKSEIPVKPGDKVLLVPYAGMSLQRDSEYLLVSDNDVLGVLE